jgi:uncharacterized membrane protein YraQ (UPF0718 family)
MAWEVWWALVLGFALSGIVQAWVPRSRLQRALGGSGPREVALATGLGATSSLRRTPACGLLQRSFLTDSGGAPRLIENAVVGPIVAALAFVCSIGNIPLAAVL